MAGAIDPAASPAPRASVVLPTYNERETLPPLLDELAAVARTMPLEIVVVDDGSPDGTGEWVEAHAATFPAALRLVRRPERLGLASAVLAGAAGASGAIVVVMDADGSHPPRVIPALVAAVRQGADVAIASRYAPGGSIGPWPISRRLISRGATVAARLLAGRRVRDPLSGFFAARREVFALRPYWGIGFKILLEILARNPTLATAEVPYAFVDRRGGRSKLGPREANAYLRLLGLIIRERGS